MKKRKTIIILIHAFIGWMLCGATMGIGMAVMPLNTTLIVHAIGAIFFFTVISYFYYKRFNYTTPIQTALIFMGFIIVVDFFIVALLINQSLEMFTNPLGTWIPFILIFFSTYFTGLIFLNKVENKTVVNNSQ